MIKKRGLKYKIGEGGYSFEFNQLIDLVNHFSAKPLNESCLTTPVEREGESRTFVTEALALFNFDGGAQDELKFQAQDVLKILEFSTKDWWLAQHPNGKVGLIPSNFVKVNPTTASSNSGGGDAFSAMAQRQKRQQQQAAAPSPVHNPGPAVLPGIAIAMKEQQQQLARQQSSGGLSVSPVNNNTFGGRGGPPPVANTARPSIDNGLPNGELYQNHSTVKAAFGGAIPPPPPDKDQGGDGEMYQNQTTILKHLASEGGNNPPPPPAGARPPQIAAKPSSNSQVAEPVGEGYFEFGPEGFDFGTAPKSVQVPAKPISSFSSPPSTTKSNGRFEEEAPLNSKDLADQFADLQSQLDSVMLDFD